MQKVLDRSAFVVTVGNSQHSSNPRFSGGSSPRMTKARLSLPKGSSGELEEPQFSFEELIIEVENFERTLASQLSLRELVSSSGTIPLGFNQNVVKPEPNNIGSIIATALNSNLYHNGFLKCCSKNNNNSHHHQRRHQHQLKQKQQLFRV